MSVFKPKTVHLDEKGFAKVLGDLEAKIMNLVWKKGDSSVRAVRDSLERQGRDLSFNSVMTVMNRLVEKGLLKKQDDNGTYVYGALVLKKDLSRIVAKDIISSVVKDPALFSASSFADLASELDEETISKLRSFLDKKQNAKT